MLKAVREHQGTGKLPEVLDKPELCHQARGGDILCPVGTDWVDAYEAAKNAERVWPPGIAAE